MQIINASIFNFFAKLESQSIIELLDAASKGDDKVWMTPLAQRMCCRRMYVCEQQYISCTLIFQTLRMYV